MRLKKGFTLAEILIVLMVIGAIATMTIPTLMKGVNEAQFKTAYKKAYNAVINIAAMENVAGKLPTSPDYVEAYTFFDTLNSYLNVKDYAASNSDKLLSGESFKAADFKVGVKYTVKTGTGDETVTKEVGTVVEPGEGATATYVTASAEAPTPWLTTEDGISYLVTKGTGSTCGTKSGINSATSATDAAGKACLLVMVDVNGVAKGPNTMIDYASGANSLSQDSSLPSLAENDRFYIYVGNDGASAGPKATTIGGRIVNDLK